MTKSFARALGLAGIVMSLMAGRSLADMMFIMEEVGPDVVLSGSGSINTSVLTPVGQWFSDPAAAISPSDAHIISGVGFDLGNSYTLFQGAVVFGPGVAADASSFSGDALDLNGGGAFIGLPPEYVSGATITTTMTFASRTLASLGATPGTYTWTIGDRNAITDTITLRVGADASVPEPTALALLSVGGLGLVMRQRARGCRSRLA